MSRYSGKIAFITGAGSGIGESLAMTLAKQGAKVIVTGKRDENINQVADNIKSAGGAAIAAKLDVTDFEGFQEIIKRTVSEEGSIDYLFNNAGITLLGEVRDMDIGHWKKLIDVNLMGVVHGVSAVYPVMVKQGYGHIVNVSSLAALGGYPTATAYVATKSAVIGLSTSLRFEAKYYGVNVSVVCPSYVNTRIFKSGVILRADLDKILKTINFPFINSADAAKSILKGVEKNKGLIIFPFYARLVWWAFRLHPNFLRPNLVKLIKDFRKIRK